jgi:hypothetical protein
VATSHFTRPLFFLQLLIIATEVLMTIVGVPFIVTWIMAVSYLIFQAWGINAMLGPLCYARFPVSECNDLWLSTLDYLPVYDQLIPSEDGKNYIWFGVGNVPQVRLCKICTVDSNTSRHALLRRRQYVYLSMYTLTNEHVHTAA